MSKDEIRYREIGILGSYLGLTAAIKLATENGLPLDWQYFAKRMIELQSQHDQLMEN